MNGVDFPEPRSQTILESAEALENGLAGTPADVTRRPCGELRSAIEREKSRKVRNMDKYKTAKEAFDAFDKMCSAYCCKDCRFDTLKKKLGLDCRFIWLYANEGDGGNV